MFLISKIVALLAQPLHWVIVLLAISLAARHTGKRWPRVCQTLALALLLLTGWQPLPDVLYRHLEQRYTEIAPDADLSAYDGVIVLGGALDSGFVAQAHSQPVINEAAERMTAATALARKYPRLQMVFTGGEGEFFGTGPSEAQRAATFFSSMDIAPTRFLYESASRNTYENAVFTAKMPGLDTHKRWLLLTSAWHMPRSMATFEKAGWNVTAYPVDFRTGNATPWTTYSLSRGPEHWNMVVREYIGIAAYKLAGRS